MKPIEEKEEVGFNPLQPNPDRVIELLTEKLIQVEKENAALVTQVEQLIAYINASAIAAEESKEMAEEKEQ